MSTEEKESTGKELVAEGFDLVTEVLSTDGAIDMIGSAISGIADSIGDIASAVIEGIAS